MKKEYVACPSCGARRGNGNNPTADFTRNFTKVVDNLESEVTNKKRVYLKNPVGIIKDCKVGFSWTQLFFGPFVPLLRGDFKYALIQWGISFLLGMIFFPLALISNIYFMFSYNKIYISELIKKGYSPADEASRQVLRIENLYS